MQRHRCRLRRLPRREMVSDEKRSACESRLGSKGAAGPSHSLLTEMRLERGTDSNTPFAVSRAIRSNDP